MLFRQPVTTGTREMINWHITKRRRTVLPRSRSRVGHNLKCVLGIYLRRLLRRVKRSVVCLDGKQQEAGADPPPKHPG